MATFTIELWQAIDITRDGIGLDTYPLFREDYRASLNTKIIEHFWNREIGMETIDMFRLAMRRKMNEIMPLYNQLYESQALVLDPFSTVNMKSVTVGESEQVSKAVAKVSGTSTSDSTSESSGRTVQQDFPQTALSGRKDYAAGAVDTSQRTGAKSEASEDSTNDTDATNAGKDSGTSSTTGYQGSVSSLLMEFRATFMNIDLAIIEDLEELFLYVFDNGDQHFPNYYRFGGYYS